MFNIYIYNGYSFYLRDKYRLKIFPAIKFHWLSSLTKITKINAIEDFNFYSNAVTSIEPSEIWFLFFWV